MPHWISSSSSSSPSSAEILIGGAVIALVHEWYGSSLTESDQREESFSSIHTRIRGRFGTRPEWLNLSQAEAQTCSSGHYGTLVLKLAMSKIEFPPDQELRAPDTNCKPAGFQPPLGVLSCCSFEMLNLLPSSQLLLAFVTSGLPPIFFRGKKE